MTKTPPTLPKEVEEQFYFTFRKDLNSLQIRYFWRDNGNWKDSNSSLNSTVASLDDLKEFLATEIERARAEGEREAIHMVIDRIEMWTDDGVIRTTDNIVNRLELLTPEEK